MISINKLVVLLFCFFAVDVVADNWQLIKNKNGIKIYTSHDSPNKLKKFKAKMEIKKDMSTILAALQDTEACSEWVYRCLTNRLVEMTDLKTRIYHTIIHSPLWFKDRDFYVQSEVQYHKKEKTLSIDFFSRPHFKKPQKNIKRITQITMNWRLKYLNENTTQVIYQISIDPQLPLKSINHMMIKKSVYQTLIKLPQLLEKPIYAEIKYDESDFETL